MASVTETVVVPGLAAPARIHVDRWGIPHLAAASEPDLFFLQGFNAARDRLWQIDLWRKRGLGLLAADFGPGFLAQDRAARLFLYRGAMAPEWAAYGPDAEAICTAFVAGINAFIDLAEREPERLPPEFALMRTRPGRWRPEDVVRIRSHGLVRNAVSEVLRAHVLARADARTDFLRKDVQPRRVPTVPEGLDPAHIPADALGTFTLATAAVTFTAERLAATLDEAPVWSRVDAFGEVVRGAAEEGSNNWAVHGSRTASGRPILGSDPHRAHAAPSLRYLVHLSAPGFAAIGAGEPAVPGISLGHNGHLAFGLTIFNADQEDVYVYETAPDDPDRYRWQDGFEPMRTVWERFAVKGCADQILACAFTRHGPVVYRGPAQRLAVAIRSAWFEPGAAPYLASLAGMRATDVASYRAAMRRWGTPSVNQVCADTQGSIAWMPVGFMPVRPNWDGLMPVPGDGGYEWAGFRDPDELPCRIDPPEGFVATANELNLPADWPHADKPIGFEWTEPFRAIRIREVLSADAAHDLAASCALQNDVVSVPARRLCAVLSSVALCEGDAAAALALLRDWDGALAAGSAAAALFELWWTSHLRPALLSHLVGDARLRALIQPGDNASLLEAIERPDERFGGDPAAERDALLVATLASAFRDGVARMGPDPQAWAWGRLHHGFFPHPLSALGPDGPPGAWSIGPLPIGGSASTPLHAGYRADNGRVITGASVRLVIDVGDWDRSLCINAPGQSGDPRSPHYDDLAETWARGGYVPLLYSWALIERDTERLIVLVPAPPP